LKPAEQTPLSALRLGELLEEAGIPAGSSTS
jgi:phenylacetaldehyde dehydrogenase